MKLLGFAHRISVIRGRDNDLQYVFEKKHTMIILFTLHFNFLMCTCAWATCLCTCQLTKKHQTIVNLILLPLRLEQMAKVQELAGFPALRREIHDLPKLYSCCNVRYIDTDMQTHTRIWKVERIQKVGCSVNFFIQILLFFPEENSVFTITSSWITLSDWPQTF